MGKMECGLFTGGVTPGNYFQEALFHLFRYCVKFSPVTQMTKPSERYMKFGEDLFTSFCFKGNLVLWKGSRNRTQLNQRKSRVLQKKDKLKIEEGTFALSEPGYQTPRKREENPSRKCL